LSLPNSMIVIKQGYNLSNINVCVVLVAHFKGTHLNALLFPQYFSISNVCIQRAPGCCAIQSINLKRMLQQEITSINFNAVSVQGTMSAFNCLAGRVMWCDETPADKSYLLEWTTHSPSNIRSRQTPNSSISFLISFTQASHKRLGQATRCSFIFQAPKLVTFTLTRATLKYWWFRRPKI
jgi:hypothetical protein